MRTWLADSSALTYSTRVPSRAARDATSSSRVDLPTPGSPLSRIAAPGTTPPPSTRSNSAMPLGQCVRDSVPRSVIGRAARPSGTTPARTAATGTPRSTTVPHAWHSAQRPTHLTLVQPHSLQAYEEVGRARGSAYVRRLTPGRCLRGGRAAGAGASDEATESRVALADAGRRDVAARIGRADDRDGVA